MVKRLVKTSYTGEKASILMHLKHKCCGGGIGRRLDIRRILRTDNDELFTMALCKVQILARITFGGE